MGEIIIKVPGDLKEVWEFDLPYENIKKALMKLEKKKNVKEALDIFHKYKHKIEFEEVSDEELHLQGD
jgi:hypothetical protein